MVNFADRKNAATSYDFCAQIPNNSLKSRLLISFRLLTPKVKNAKYGVWHYASTTLDRYNYIQPKWRYQCVESMNEKVCITERLWPIERREGDGYVTLTAGSSVFEQ